MPTTHEMAFMAIASKNSFLTHEEAAQCFAEFQTQPAEGRRSIEELVREKGLLTENQIQLISAAAAKIMANRAGEAASPATPAPELSSAPPAPPPTSRFRVAAQSTPPPSVAGKP